MWNHHSSSKLNNPNSKASSQKGQKGIGLKNDVVVGDVMVDKVEKHLDLTNYLNFLHTLFSLSTSDSENSDVEPDSSSLLVGLDLNNSALAIPSPQPHPPPPPPLNIITKIGLKSSSASSPFISAHPQQSITSHQHPAASSTTSVPCSKRSGRKSHTTGSSSLLDVVDSSSTNSSSYCDDTSFLQSDLTPLSDLELNNLLKRTNYDDIEVEVDPMAFGLVDDQDQEPPAAAASGTSEGKKKKSNKKKKKSKKTKSADENPRQNRPNSGGRGNGSAASHGSGGSSSGGGSGGFNGSVSDTSGNSSSKSRGSSNNNTSNNSSNKNNSTGGGSQLNHGTGSGSVANCSSRKSKETKKGSVPSSNCFISANTTTTGTVLKNKLFSSSSSSIINSKSTDISSKANKSTFTSSIAAANSTTLKTKSLSSSLTATTTTGGNGKRAKNASAAVLYINNINNSRLAPNTTYYSFGNAASSDDNDSLSDYLSMAATAATVAPKTNNHHSSSFLRHHHEDPHRLPPISNCVDKFMQEDDEEMVMVSDDESNSRGQASSSRSSLGSKSDDGSGSSKRTGTKRKRGVVVAESSEGKKKKKDGGKNKKILLQKQAKFIELMNLTRKKIYTGIAKKEVLKAQRTTSMTHKDMLAIKRKLAQACSKAVRQKAIQSQKIAKEAAWRAKRLTREMQAFWRQADRIEKENKKRLEKEEEERRKQDVEALEAKRHQQNLNFLITETELFAHLATKNIHNDEEDRNNYDHDNSQAQIILDRLKGQNLENHEVESQKIKVKINVQEALEAQKIHAKLFHVEPNNMMSSLESHSENGHASTQEEDRENPLFVGSLKNYQLYGVNWLTKLFDNGINGVLADEKGLGKTVQTIAFLAHLAENSGIWGPFLVITPSSSLHYWQQEIKRFVPKFKIVPYWGNPQERKILRQFWQQTNLHTPEASFHVVVTSYNVVVQDLKYFNKIRWQYLILDEAQAIKTTVSTRWKALIGFNCRNRLLLLTGIPPVQNQNSVNELLSLLHFIMPSLFISQEDFTDYFSKDVESDGGLEKSCLARIYTVLQQFMLRRTKKDVETELLCDKIELFVPGPRFFHANLARKIIVEDLLRICSNSSSSPNRSSSPQQHNDAKNLLSLVMQFRKVCNHPDLFEGKDMKSPLFMDKILYPLPKLLFQDKLYHDNETKNSLCKENFSIFHPASIHSSSASSRSHRKAIEDLHVANFCGETESPIDEWSFIRYSGLSESDIYKVIFGGTVERMIHLVKSRREKCMIRQRTLWKEDESLQLENFQPSEFLIYDSFVEFISENLKNLVFTSYTEPFYQWDDSNVTFAELLDDDVTTNNVEQQQKSVIMLPNNNDSCNNHTSQIMGDLVPLHVPKFMYNLCPKVRSIGLTLHISSAGPTLKWIEDPAPCSLVEFNLIMHGSLERTFFTPRDIVGLLDLENDYFDSRAIEWNNGSTSDYEEDHLPFIPMNKPKLGRGTGKRGRPPSRVRVQMRDLSGGGGNGNGSGVGDYSIKRGPGRPRLKPIGPLNQGIRGRPVGRPRLKQLVH